MVVQISDYENEMPEENIGDYTNQFNEFPAQYSEYIYTIESFKNEMGLLSMANNEDITPLLYAWKKVQFEYIESLSSDEDTSDIELRLAYLSMAMSLDKISKQGGGFPV